MHKGELNIYHLLKEGKRRVALLEENEESTTDGVPLQENEDSTNNRTLLEESEDSTNNGKECRHKWERL